MSTETLIPLSVAARKLGVYWDTLTHAAAAGWLKLRRRRDGSPRDGRVLVTWGALRALVQDPRCWLFAPPERMRDPLLRAYALDARRRTGGDHWRSTKELAAHYQIAATTLVGWRTRCRWPEGGHWERWIGAWYLWAPELPPPPADRRLGPTPEMLARRRAAGVARRARVVAAVLAAGGPPGRGGNRPFWPRIGASLGMPAITARDNWDMAVKLGEVPDLSTASQEAA